MIEEAVNISLVQEPYVRNLPLKQQRLEREGGIYAIYKQPNIGEKTRAAIYFKGKPENAPKLVGSLSKAF